MQYVKGMTTIWKRVILLHRALLIADRREQRKFLEIPTMAFDQRRLLLTHRAQLALLHTQRESRASRDLAVIAFITQAFQLNWRRSRMGRDKVT